MEVQRSHSFEHNNFVNIYDKKRKKAVRPHNLDIVTLNASHSFPLVN